MRVLIDACLPVQLKDHLPFPDLKTTRELGWQAKKNGELLTLAQQQFDVLVTMDKNIPSQQLLSRFTIALVIVRAHSNRLAELMPLVPEITRMIHLAKKGQAVLVTG